MKLIIVLKVQNIPKQNKQVTAKLKHKECSCVQIKLNQIDFQKKDNKNEQHKSISILWTEIHGSVVISSYIRINNIMQNIKKFFKINNKQLMTKWHPPAFANSHIEFI